ncbi:GTP-binding protein [Aquimarina sp. TRL1]|uniref:GTP-binding protein n=1 Tax=Aquimarina sp. (strain TRL1) TaxID=2736252 RepID=UPI00158EB1EC|nr:GTP-binding protein [Aquimarina sp. TRL1]QKX07252.1 GTP-binding protein [Aquimarina sp. TRL1]
MSNTPTIALRPRFKVALNYTNKDALQRFETAKKEQKDVIITRVDDHVFLKIPKNQQHFWSPQLHLEINEKTSNSAILYGLFGPSPTVWTLFMFLHFIVAAIFIACSIWTYSNWSLGTDYGIQLFLTLFMVLVWFILYAAGRIGRATGKKEMYFLYDFMNHTLQLKK